MLKRKSTPVKNSSNTNSNSRSSNAPSITYITQSTIIKADMFCEDDVRIAGTVEGEIESKKKVMLTESGKVKGTIHSPEADISGKVTGDVKAAKSLVLRSSAIVDGKIFTKKLTIENGAQVKGSFQVGPNVSISSNDSGPVHKSNSDEKNKTDKDS
ncbi:MAG: polymer-forming cytoskeletal protein [Gracilimonas sp.]|uniref:bactofilin family protein n=1 Tax=Gracilimonas sp. TaxID=1974203 RepID=UPI0032EE4268